MSLSCERLGFGPNGPLNAAERVVYAKFAHGSPQTQSPMRYVTETVFRTNLGPRNISSYPTPTTPMDIDSGAIDEDIEMQDAPAERRVTFTPPPDYCRPTSSNTTAMPPRTALSQHIHLINEADSYVPAEPYPLDQDVDYSQPELHGFTTAGRTPMRPTNTFSVPDDSFSELSPEISSTPLPQAPTVAKWRIAPREVSPQDRPILEPVSQRVARSPPGRVLSPESLYPSLQAVSRKRRRPGDFAEEPEQREQPRTTVGRVVSIIRAATTALVSSLCSLIKPRRTIEQEIIAVHTAAHKRRAIARQDIEAAPVPDATTMATPPDSRDGSVEKDITSQAPGIISQASPPQIQTTVPQSSESQGTESRKDSLEQVTMQQAAPPQKQMSVPQSSEPQQTGSRQDSLDQVTVQQPAPPQKQMSVPQSSEPQQTGSREDSREQISVPQQSPLRSLTTTPNSSTSLQTQSRQDAGEDNTGTQPPEPQMQAVPRRIYSNYSAWLKTRKQKPYRSLQSKKEPDRAERERLADDRVNALAERAKNIAIENPHQKAVRDSVRTRKSRIREINEQEAREKAQAKKAEEEAKLLAEREAEALKRAEEQRKQAEIAAAEEAARQTAKKTLIPPITTEWQQKIADLMATRDPAKVLGKDSRGAELTRKTLGCILPQENEHEVKDLGDSNARRGPNGWLNDEGVDGFIGAIVDRRRQQDGYVKGQGAPAFANFSCQWYNTVKKNGIKSIARWSRRQQIGNEKLLGCEKIFFPVNTGAHWVLLVLSPKARTMEFLDSAGGSGRSFFKLGRDWLEMELGVKYVAAEWKELGSKSESQRNMDDCGVFTCMNALASAKGAEFTEVNAVRNMPKAREFITQVLLNGGFSSEIDL